MPEGSSLARLLKERKSTILERWSEDVRRTGTSSRYMDEAKLRNSLPVLLDRVTQMAEQLVHGERPAPPPHSLSRDHALHRVESGYGIDEVVLDYTELRDSAYVAMEASGTSFTIAELRLLDRAIDAVMLDTVRHFVAVRERRLHALERLFAGMSEASDLQTALEGLISVFLESVPSVDTATVLLVEGDRLVVRATRGLEREREVGFSLRFGEGFAGTIAAERRPILLRDARTDPLVRSPHLRERGVRALYGMPLVHDDRVLGVVHMGSCTATSFTDDDLTIFRALAQRATFAVGQAHLVEQLTTAAHFREQFVAVVSHDLRTPLNSISLGSQLILSSEDASATAAHTAARIARSAERMRRMIDQLLDFTRARLGSGLDLQIGDVQLEQLCREVVAEIEMANPARTIVVAARGELVGRWDDDRVKQLVSNLVDNAVAHGRPDMPVEVRLDGTDAREVTIEVHNQGTPIAPADLDGIFEPFRRAARTRAGLGLGLFIAREVARAHGGRIDVTSSAEDGTRFVVHLPRTRPAGG